MMEHSGPSAVEPVDIRAVETGELAELCPEVSRALAGCFDLEHGEAADIPKYVWPTTREDSRVALIARSHGHVVGAAVGTILEGPTGSMSSTSNRGREGFLDLIAVHPATQRGGIGRRLVAAWEEFAAAAGAERLTVGGKLDRYAWPGVDVRYTAALCLLLRLGYERTGGMYNMDVTLSPEVAPSTALLDRVARRGVTIRRATAADSAVVDAYIGSEWSDVWRREVLLGVGRPTPPVFLAWESGTLVGFGAHGIYRPSLYGPIAVDPRMQGCGLGDALSRFVLSDMYDRGVHTCEIGWVAETAIPFYSRTVGARLGRCFWTLGKLPGRPA